MVTAPRMPATSNHGPEAVARDTTAAAEVSVPRLVPPGGPPASPATLDVASRVAPPPATGGSTAATAVPGSAAASTAAGRAHQATSRRIVSPRLRAASDTFDARPADAGTAESPAGAAP